MSIPLNLYGGRIFFYLLKKFRRIFFVNNLDFKVGDDFTTSFWLSSWLKEETISSLFPSLFAISRLQDASIASTGGWINGEWHWNDFGNPIFPDSETGAAAMLRLLLGQQPSVSMVCAADVPRWRRTEDFRFSLSSCYGALCVRYTQYGPPNCFDFVWDYLWKIEAPLKCKAFEWKCFLNRIATKDLLVHRDISFAPSNLACVFCDGCAESSSHYLLLCQRVNEVWLQIASWIGLSDYKAGDFKESFWKWHLFCRRKNLKKGKVGCVWLTTIWSLWVFKNGIIFKDWVWNSRDAVWGVKALLWRWAFIENISQPNCNFYEFDKNSLLYFS
ncbi:uncharacterized protein LOC131657611 [Vicia villosa]|uniref:uncharacterized protein LOC131657611 n=1 Tax=Vicia villosa TaxID=3911 RepID=UPI00273C31BA|nr:uncharacterized protein LOC131657611 [Vicia villosa]